MSQAVNVCGKYAVAKIFTEAYDIQSYRQIKELCDQPFAEGAKIRIMPDVHAGAGCVIGFTADLGEKVIPDIVGVDIGCGMLVAELGKVDLDLATLDKVIRDRVPAGMNVHDAPAASYEYEIDGLICKPHLHNMNWLLRSMGTLGGGNHFIELDADDDGDKYLVIHTGSRNLGKQVADFYQNLAISNFYGKNKEKDLKTSIIQRLKSEGREREIQHELSKIQPTTQNIPKDLCYLEGRDRASYLHDMMCCQIWADRNRYDILCTILHGLGMTFGSCLDVFTTLHNYIGDDLIIRKGAVSAKKGERLIIPLNMKDGSLICIGKGNTDWNCSAPHGAGRLYSRSEAKMMFDVDEYKRQMQGIYTTSADESTLDECPMAYKPAHCIIDAIGPTVDIVKRIRPIYNFKAGE